MKTLNDWIEERRTIHANATRGPWHWQLCQPCHERGVDDVQVWDHTGNRPVAQWIESGSENELRDAESIVDAHNEFPRALDAIERVLELHKPVRTPSGQLCSTCAEESDCAYALPWPCPTVQAIEGAINHD